MVSTFIEFTVVESELDVRVLSKSNQMYKHLNQSARLLTVLSHKYVLSAAPLIFTTGKEAIRERAATTPPGPHLPRSYRKRC
mmetsp:Transcript_80818/g.216682  ORF Transcript_80818/g.216682 Transcript_80818/m.216682 type:complete len:82 (+) Transcript_80818:873-1118(+)